MELANCKIKILTVSRGEGKSGQEVKILLGKECTEHEQEPITWHESQINPTIIQTWVLDREELEKNYQNGKSGCLYSSTDNEENIGANQSQ